MPYSSTFPKVCEYEPCRRSFDAKKPKIRFCSKRCATLSRVTPESRQRSRSVLAETGDRPDVKRKLSAHLLGPTNPFHNPEVQAKAQRSLRLSGYHLLNGGNGTGMTEPQELLWRALGQEDWIPELAIKTGNGPGYPSNYKVDLGHVGHMIAIEVHGRSHRGKTVQAKDVKKRNKLEELGWLVLIYWNEAVHQYLDYILEDIYGEIQIRSNRDSAD